MGQSASQPPAPTPVQTRTVSKAYHHYLTSEDGPKEPREIQKLERRRIIGLPVGENPQDYAYEHFREGLTLRPHPGLVISRGTTLGALSGMRRLSMWPFTPSSFFLASEAAQVILDELGDNDDPDTGLEHHLDEGCASDEEKERMRSIVQNALVVLHDQEHDELHALVIEALRQSAARHRARGEAEMDRLDPTGEMRRAAATRTAKKLTVAQLRIKLAELGQPTDGTKPVLVARYVARATR